MPIGTYNLSKGTHPLGRVTGLAGYIGGYLGTEISYFADFVFKIFFHNSFDARGSTGRRPFDYRAEIKLVKSARCQTTRARPACSRYRRKLYHIYIYIYIYIYTPKCPTFAAFLGLEPQAYALR